jgi:anti-anti-sigma regulatory factor
MTAKKKKPLMDHDPLEWVEGEQEDSANTEAAEKGASESVVEVSSSMENALNQITLQEREKLERVSELQELFLQALEKDEDIKIDASAVKTIDAAALQLLVLFFDKAVKQGLEIAVIEPSDSFKEAVRLLGLNDLFEL